MDALPEHLAWFIRDLVTDHDERLLLTALWLVRSGSLGDILEHHELIVDRIRTVEDLLAADYPALHAFVIEQTRQRESQAEEPPGERLGARR